MKNLLPQSTRLLLSLSAISILGAGTILGCESAPLILLNNDEQRLPDRSQDDADSDGQEFDDLNFDSGSSDEDSNGSAPAGGNARCGNGKLEPSEFCDDGNEDSGDGCQDDCLTVEDDYLCVSEGNPCQRLSTCGNGIIEGQEACDDGNTDSDDGCSSACKEIEQNFSCFKPGVVCVAVAVCGNGVRERGEACDDHEDVPSGGDGCSETCSLEDETGTVWECPASGSCIRIECGDGIRTRNEDCDDGNTSSDDGCSATCTEEAGYRCSSIACRPICGDGIVLGGEACDDNDLNRGDKALKSGDGCSRSCRLEPNFECTGEPSLCVSTIVCGDAELDPGEVCDPGISGQSDCFGPTSSTPCAGYALVTPEPVCDNGVLELGEGCDGGTNAATRPAECAVDCLSVTSGWSCPAVGYCFEERNCGDGRIQSGEQCDDNGSPSIVGDGCDSDCQIEAGFFCSGEPSACTDPVCGNSLLEPGEACDDGGVSGSGGCAADCASVVSGWVCPPGESCQPICGNNAQDGNEQCDDGNTNDTDGCSSACQVEFGYDCDGASCVLTTCPSIIGTATAAEQGEGCDDGNTVAGDGCGPTCQSEPAIAVGPSPVVTSLCGDGILIENGSSAAVCTDGNPGNNENCAEACDDGNTLNGDGCSDECQVETGWDCIASTTRPASVGLKIKYRDFKSRFEDTTNTGNSALEAGGHPHFGFYSRTGFSGGRISDMTGAVCNITNTATCGRLDSDGKPVLADTAANTDTIPDNADAFGLWYRSTNASALNGANGPIEIFDFGEDSFITLAQDATNNDRYVFEDGSFYELDNEGFGNTPGSSHNYHFTSEIRYFFRYERGQELQFYGDDDVWVYVNGRLAVDIGGIHGQAQGRIVLGDEDSSCSSTSTAACALGASTYDSSGILISVGEDLAPSDARFDIEVGKLYEIVIFQAERSPTGSNYKLTLDGFLSPRSSCKTTCGDDEVGGPEVCDEGFGAGDQGGDSNREDEYGACRLNCTQAFCGDSVNDEQLALDVADPEQCDNGANVDSYVAYADLPMVMSSVQDLLDAGRCAPGCEVPSFCGDGVVDFSQGEQCDDAVNDGSYGTCGPDCTLADYCGDGVVSGSDETCDCGDGSSGENCANGSFEIYSSNALGCGFDCKATAYCGDNIRNGAENCDGTDVTTGRVCKADCDYDAVCGDGVLNLDEACDNGVNNSSTPGYEGCNDNCEQGPRCGDDILQEVDGEECDDGTTGNSGAYGQCTDECLFGPNCGDGVVQASSAEACDNGFNDDTYTYPGDTNTCGSGCVTVGSCGDEILQGAFELCDAGAENDDSTYDGCTSNCEFGAYCGDGITNGPEVCDDGPNNVAYATTSNGCSFSCTNEVPFCGDKIRNGPEECDEGNLNGPDYGQCTESCTLGPRCGDGVVQTEKGEDCDEGAQGSLDCSPSCRTRFSGLR